jgi:hypothetical protein
MERPARWQAGKHWLLVRLEGVRDWAVNRLTGQRCFGCNRRLLWHTPRQRQVCCSVPLPITITEQGRAWLADQATAELDGLGQRIA